MSASVRSLADKRLLERRASPDDARQVLLFLTQTAEASRVQRERRWGQQLENLLALLTDDERARILEAVPALRALADHLSDPRTYRS